MIGSQKGIVVVRRNLAGGRYSRQPFLDLAMPVLETPSRVWRRIQAADDLALPSLPSLPAIDDDDLEEEDETDPQPIHSRPTPSLVASTKKSTTVRFAETHESFEFSDILPITHQSILTDDDGDKPQVDYSIDLKSHISVSINILTGYWDY